MNLKGNSKCSTHFFKNVKHEIKSTIEKVLTYTPDNCIFEPRRAKPNSEHQHNLNNHTKKGAIGAPMRRTRSKMKLQYRRHQRGRLKLKTPTYLV